MCSVVLIMIIVQMSVILSETALRLYLIHLKGFEEVLPHGWILKITKHRLKTSIIFYNV